MNLLRMHALVLLFLFSVWALPSPFASSLQAADSGRAACIVVTGLGGVPEYEENFEKWGESLREICSGQGAATYPIDGRAQKKEEVLRVFDEVASGGESEIWLFLIGHGTHDGRAYKFNIRGPDLTDEDLAEFLESAGQRRKFVIAATSSSGGLTSKLTAPKSVVVAATKSEREKQPPLFMSFFIEGARSAEADVNKDGRVALREIFDYTETMVQKWYEEKGRLQTEHPVLMESEESPGLAELAYLNAPPEQAYRSLEAQGLTPEKQRIEREIEDLKLRKNEMSSAEYYRELERLLVELATVNQRIDELEGDS